MKRKAKRIQNLKMPEKYPEAELTFQKNYGEEPSFKGGEKITWKAEEMDKEIKKRR